MTTATTPRGFTIDSLNHVVLRVRDLERSKAFYVDVLGLQIRRERPGRMVFLHCGENDHDVALMQLAPGAPPADENRAGLYHFALRLGGLDELRAAYQHLTANSANIVGITHHGDTKSIYLKDPDGLEIEVFCDCEHDANGTEAQVRAELGAPA
jgi:catechol-2,3-dioxygenase